MGFSTAEWAYGSKQILEGRRFQWWKIVRCCKRGREASGSILENLNLLPTQFDTPRPLLFYN